MSRLAVLAGFGLAGCGLAGCALADAPISPAEAGSPLSMARLETAPDCIERHRFVQEGVASWYGPRLDGKATANGQVFSMGAMTAAHRKLPLGTRIKVTNLENGRSADFVVNDRGPYRRGRVLDVSRAGARELGFRKDGTAKVRIESVERC